jgi:hypothetical protein
VERPLPQPSGLSAALASLGEAIRERYGGSIQT